MMAMKQHRTVMDVVPSVSRKAGLTWWKIRIHNPQGIEYMPGAWPTRALALRALSEAVQL